MSSSVASSTEALKLAALGLPQRPPAQQEAQATPQPLFQRADTVQISQEAQALLAAEQTGGA